MLFDAVAVPGGAPFLAVIEISGLVLALCILVALAIGAAAAYLLVQIIGGRSIQQARQDADRIIEDAKRDGETTRRQMELDAKNELIARREEFERDYQEKRNELKETERRLTTREDTLDRKLDVLATKEKNLEQLEAKLEEDQQQVKNRQAELDGLVSEQKQTLERISKLSEDEARKTVLQRVESEMQHEAGEIIRREVSKAEEEARDQSRKITLQAIQRYAAEHTAASTVTVVDIPSDDMKGRVIGREGRNIRAFEQATGVDVIVDDTPGVVVVSCFDPIRRAVASESLSRLIEDGRIHPARIEEMVETVQEEVRERVLRYGKDACIEANIRGLDPKVVEMMGRLHYRTSYGQNILRHSLEVSYLSQVIADELGLDGQIARRAGFLHDIGKSMDHEIEGSHPQIGMDFCRRHGEKEEVLNAVGGHHGDIEITTPYTTIVTAADAISGARPGARRETLERYIKRLEQLEGIATSFDGVQQAYAIQAGREVRVIVDAKKIDDGTSAKVARDIAHRVEQEMTYPGEVRVTVLREVRSVEYAR